jgi:multidrug resistance efflux pump
MAGPAPIYSLSEDTARAESAAWARFAATQTHDRTEFYANWLAILCLQIERVGAGVVLLGPDKAGAYLPAAVWPHVGRDIQYLVPTAERTLKERRGIVVSADGAPVPSPERRAFVGYPIEVAGVLHGTVVLDLSPGPEQALQRGLRLMHWASAWLVDQFRKRALEEREARLSRMAVAMGLVATALQERHFVPSALAVSNELAGRLQCDRVSIGWDISNNIEVRAISHTVTFDPKMDLSRLIGQAMDEVLDLDVALVYPPRDDVESGATAHAELAREFHDVAICSVPLRENGQAIGALTFERSSGPVFDADTVELCKTIGELLGPILKLKKDIERNLLRHAYETVRTGAQTLFGPRHTGVKLVALVVAGAVLFGSLATGTYRVSAKTVIEGAVQRVVAAPFEGYILQSFVRAGDTVREGQVLCRLDDRDLKLEQAKLTSEREQLLRKHRQALAKQERATVVIVAAQIEQVDAALSLVSEKLSRAILTAPFDGVVVSGDLRELVGTPVELGKVLFQVAPLDSYRVILEVDERDIAQVALRQEGELTLSGMPNQRMDFSVQQMTPVSTPKEGQNYFRVEAHLLSPPEGVRPGMEGVGKIVIADRNLMWIATHGLIDWLRLFAWKWMP